MTATITDVRNTIGDTETPYIFDDATVQAELDAAEQYLTEEGISVETALGKRAHKLQAAIFLVSDHLGKIKNRAIKSIKEGDASIDYVSLESNLQNWKAELRDILTKLRDIPFEAEYDSY